MLSSFCILINMYTDHDNVNDMIYCEILTFCKAPLLMYILVHLNHMSTNINFKTMHNGLQVSIQRKCFERKSHVFILKKYDSYRKLMILTHG